MTGNVDNNGLVVPMGKYKGQPIETVLKQGTERSWKTLHVECKPTLGDDYPSALRQVNRYKSESNSVKCVVAGEIVPTSVTLEQVTAIYASSGIKLVLMAEINHAPLTQHGESGTP